MARVAPAVAADFVVHTTAPDEARSVTLPSLWTESEVAVEVPEDQVA